MSEITVQTCCNCEWLVTTGDSKACNAFAIPTDDVTEGNLCGEWELRDIEALKKRNKLTAEKVTRSSLPMTSSFPHLRSLDEIYYEQQAAMRTREMISMGLFYNTPSHVTEELQRRQASLNKGYEIIEKIDRQVDYIRCRFNIEPTQVLISPRSLRLLLQHVKIERDNISYGANGRRYWRHLEIVECVRLNDEEIVEVLFLNQLV